MVAEVVPEVEEIFHRVPLEARPPKFNKYSEFIDRTTNFVPTKTRFEQLKEYVFGKDEATIKFDNALEEFDYYEKLKQSPRWQKRLGAAEAQG